MDNMPYEDFVALADMMDRHELTWMLLCFMVICEDKSVHAAEKLQDTTTAKRYAAVAEALKMTVPLAT
jgi:hypothetical protein